MNCFLNAGFIQFQLECLVGVLVKAWKTETDSLWNRCALDNECVVVLFGITEFFMGFRSKFTLLKMVINYCPSTLVHFSSHHQNIHRMSKLKMISEYSYTFNFKSGSAVFRLKLLNQYNFSPFQSLFK